MSDDLMRMTDLKLNDPVTITLPAYVWLGFMAAIKSNTEFHDWNTDRILGEVEQTLIHPADYKSLEAKQSGQVRVGPFAFPAGSIGAAGFPPGPEDL